MGALFISNGGFSTKWGGAWDLIAWTGSVKYVFGGIVSKFVCVIGNEESICGKGFDENSWLGEVDVISCGILIDVVIFSIGFAS